MQQPKPFRWSQLYVSNDVWIKWYQCHTINHRLIQISCNGLGYSCLLLPLTIGQSSIGLSSLTVLL